MKKGILKGFVVLLSAAAVSSCGSGGGGLPISIPVIVAISPSSVTVPAGATQQFNASVTGSSDTAVTWRVNGETGGDATIGTISASGLYTAPISPPATGKVTVSAASHASANNSGQAVVTISFSNAMLSGEYSFLLEGDDSNGFFAAIGSFQADGNGNILNGFEDINYGTGFMPNITLTGTYSVGPDGRGTATITNSLGSSKLALLVISDSRARFVEFNKSANGEGILLKRDPSAFSTAKISGGYVFGFGGYALGGDVAALAGRFTADGAGNLTAGAEDTNLGGTITSNGTLTGTYNVDSKGRGTATIHDALGTGNFVFHVVSADRLFFVERDFPYPVVDGNAQRQQVDPFSTSSVNGHYAFLISGFTSVGGAVIAGVLSPTDRNGPLSAGVFDENNTGVASTDVSLTGSSSISPNGRGTVTISSSLGDSPIAFYLANPQEAFLISTDPKLVGSGTLRAQTGGPFGNKSVAGTYGFLLFTSNTDTDQVGQAILDSSGSINGTENINDAKTLSANLSLTGTFTMDTNGRATATMVNSKGTSNMVFYALSNSWFLALQLDAASVTNGNFEKQF